MSLKDLIRLLLKNWKLLVAVPLVLAVSIFFFTRGAKRVYVSDTTIYTGIASGYSITGDVQADFFTANTAFDNLITLINSRETKEEVIIRLLASHLMLRDLDPNLLTWNSYQNVQDVLSRSVRDQLVAPTFASTYDNIRNYYNADTSNEIYELLNSTEEFYSFDALSRLSTNRISSSDIIRIQYETTDPAICKHTLELLTEVFINRNRDLREGQTESVIEYYEVEARTAFDRLEELEQRYLVINEENNIINYEEQSKNIASHREDLYTAYAEVEMEYLAAQSALNAVEQRLQSRSAATLSSNELIELRNRVANLTTRIANIEIFNNPSPGTAEAEELNRLRSEMETASQAIQQRVEDYYTQTHSIEGIPSQGLLDEWVRNVILVEEGAAKLQVMDRRKEDFQREYERMAPLGATLRRIEREIDLAEREYLTFLNSLNASRLNQQNIELTAQLRIVDQPFLPVQPRSSGRMILLLVGVMGGFISVAAIFIGRELLDETIKKPSNAVKKTGLPVAGVIPLLTVGNPLEDINDKNITQLARNLLMKSKTLVKGKPLMVGILSTEVGEGKSTAINILKAKLNSIGVIADSYHPSTDQQMDEGPETYFYQAKDFIEIHPDVNTFPLSDGKIILIEFPSLSEDIFPLGLISRLNYIIMAVRANRKWTKTDEKALDSIVKISEAPVEVLLTGVMDYHFEEL